MYSTWNGGPLKPDWKGLGSVWLRIFLVSNELCCTCDGRDELYVFLITIKSLINTIDINRLSDGSSNFIVNYVA